jgi:DDE family transposase
MLSELTESVVETIRLAAGKLTGFARRQFQAEMSRKYCEGSPRRAEEVFGWGREAVNTGLNELRTGIRCVEDFSSRGRPKTEEVLPELVPQIHALVEPSSQADPKFQTPLAYTRMTAKAVHQHLEVAAAKTGHPVPAERTVYDILNRLGYRLRRVRKTQPQKNYLRPTPSSTISEKFTRKPPASRKPCASRSTPRPK